MKHLIETYVRPSRRGAVAVIALNAIKSGEAIGFAVCPQNHRRQRDAISLCADGPDLAPLLLAEGFSSLVASAGPAFAVHGFLRHDSSDCHKVDAWEPYLGW